MKITFSRLIALETKVETVRFPYGAQGACSMYSWSSCRVFGFLLGAERFFAEFGDLLVELRDVDLGEVVVVGLLDAFPGQQRLEEVVRVRVVLEPVGPAGVEVGRRVLPITVK